MEHERLIARVSSRVLVGLGFALTWSLGNAQPGNADGETPASAAPVDLTGFWVSVISEDWRFRMSVAQKGDWDIVPLNDEGLRAAENADITSDPCMAYGAAGLMRIPSRFHIRWENGSTLRIDSDAGMQTRRLHFAGFEPPVGEPSRQGHSVAEWRTSEPPPDVGASVSPGSELHVVTTNMTPGYYFKHGVPYSSAAVQTEYFVSVSEENGDEYLLVTSIVDDPEYLREEFVRTLVFKKEPDDSRWNSRSCEVP